MRAPIKQIIKAAAQSSQGGGTRTKVVLTLRSEKCSPRILQDPRFSLPSWTLNGETFKCVDSVIRTGAKTRAGHFIHAGISAQSVRLRMRSRTWILSS